MPERNSHCRRGHALVPENMWPSSRACKLCRELLHPTLGPTTKDCLVCGEEFTARTKIARYCSKRCSAKAYYHENIEQERKRGRDKHRAMREKVIAHYGGVCACPTCGITEPDFLAVDHIENNGNEHRKKLKGTNIYLWLIKNSFPEGFQLLCFNCNSAKAFFGGCPHTKLRETQNVQCS